MSYETGFHGGGFSFAQGLSSYKPETIGALTIGSKNRFFDNRLQLNVEAFRWTYDNQQFSEFGYDLGTPPNLVFYTTNVGNSTIQGVDTDVAFQVTPTTQLTGDVEYLDTKYNNFITYDPNFGLAPQRQLPLRAGDLQQRGGLQGQLLRQASLRRSEVGVQHQPRTDFRAERVHHRGSGRDALSRVLLRLADLSALADLQGRVPVRRLGHPIAPCEAMVRHGLHQQHRG